MHTPISGHAGSGSAVTSTRIILAGICLLLVISLALYRAHGTGAHEWQPQPAPTAVQSDTPAPQEPAATPEQADTAQPGEDGEASDLLGSSYNHTSVTVNGREVPIGDDGSVHYQSDEGSSHVNVNVSNQSGSSGNRAGGGL